MTHLNFIGVADLPTAGGSEKTLEFTTSSTSLSGFSFAVTRTGSTTEINTPWLGFPHGMTLYTTELCGQVEGIIPNICFTPDSASQLLLKLASVLGQAAPITLTNVTVDQLVIIASTMRTGPQTTGIVPRLEPLPPIDPLSAVDCRYGGVTIQPGRAGVDGPLPDSPRPALQ